MAIVNVPKTDTFDLWRQKTNQIAQTIGDPALLQTTVNTSIVDAINSIFNDLRRVLIRSIGMS
jgi:hypothetical protein